MPNKKMINRTLHREIDLLKKMFIDLGALVEDRLRKACIILETWDKDLAKEIIRTDNEIDHMEVQIEEECLKVLALHQPVASDLRLIIAIIKINNELERIGDMAVSIARRVQVIHKKGRGSFTVDYSPMATKVLEMIKMSLDALVTENADFARRIFIEDEEIDALRNKAYKAVVEELDADTDHAAALLNMYLLSIHLERIGDRACNIAEEVFYLVEGDIVRNESNPF